MRLSRYTVPGVILIGLLLLTPRVKAITYGFVDTTNAFSNTGAFIVKAPSGRIFPICTGTLIAPNAFLTASHCTITPATLPAADLLDTLSARNELKGTVYTAVGYGLQNRVVGGGQPFLQDRNPVPRMYAFSSFNALNGGYLRLSMNPATGDGGTCFGDSGGPNFLNVNGTRTLVAITITGDAVCRATNVVYRLDIAASRAFLAPYVSLPWQLNAETTR